MAESTPGSGCTSAVYLEAFHPHSPEAADQECFNSQEQEKWSHNNDSEEPFSGNELISNENTNQPLLPQYLYVQPNAGKDSPEI